MRALVAALLVAVAVPAYADQTSGTVASWDPSTNTLILTDRTVWKLPKDIVVPENLAPGDKLVITYGSAADNGWVGTIFLKRI